MSARAYATTDYARRGVAIYLTGERHYGSGPVTAIGQPTEIVMTDIADEGAVAEPTLRLPDDMARALLDALSAHYGGTTDMRSLRKDYDDERRRVDRLIGYLAPPAASAAEPKASIK